MFKNKILLILIGFYIFWLGVLPFIVNNVAQKVCEKPISFSNYQIQIVEPKIELSVLPNIKIYAKNFIKYCLDNNYITQEQYDIEYNNIEQATNISSFNIGTFESKISKIATKYRKTIKNY